MWRSFIYRLVLYMFISLIVFSLSAIVLIFFHLLIFDEQMINWTNKPGLYTALIVPIILIYSCLATAYLLVTYITVSIYLMALHNYQFTYKSDLCLLISTVVYLTIVGTFTIIYFGNFNNGRDTIIAYDIFLYLQFLSTLYSQH